MKTDAIMLFHVSLLYPKRPFEGCNHIEISSSKVAGEILATLLERTLSRLRYLEQQQTSMEHASVKFYFQKSYGVT